LYLTLALPGQIVKEPLYKEERVKCEGLNVK